MTTQEIIKLQSLLCKMKQGPYEYWNEPGNDILAAECKEGDGEPIAALPGIHTLPDEFRAIAALLNAAPELIRLALLTKLKDATPKTGIEMIAAERERQITAEGYTTAHDDEHRNGQLAAAAACYAGWFWMRSLARRLWPFDEPPTECEDKIRVASKSGALMAAEIDRLARMNQTANDDGPRKGRFVKTRDHVEGKVLNLERQPGLILENDENRTMSPEERLANARVVRHPTLLGGRGYYIVTNPKDQRWPQLYLRKSGKWTLGIYMPDEDYFWPTQEDADAALSRMNAGRVATAAENQSNQTESHE